MKNLLVKLFKLTIGMILCSSSTVFMLNSNLGLLPWDVFHQGLSNILRIDIGLASIIASFIVLMVAFLLGEKIGIGTLFNIVVSGILIDLINNNDLIPKAPNLIAGLLMILIGMVCMGLGCYFYISCALGCGPRDSTMIGLSKRFNKSVNIIKAIMEVTVLIVGIILGGKFGLGTIIPALFIGIFIELPFKLTKVDVKEIKHSSIRESYVHILELIKSNKENDKENIIHPSHN